MRALAVARPIADADLGHVIACRVTVATAFGSVSQTSFPARPFDDGSVAGGVSAVAREFAAVDHYTLQAAEFARAVRGDGAVPVSLEDAIGNMAVIDALFCSAQTHSWQNPADF